MSSPVYQVFSGYIPNPFFKAFHDFVKIESLGSIVLILAALLALLISNSSWEHFYAALLHTSIEISFLNTEIKPLEFWINDGLMAVFFLVVGIELKREMLDGELSNFSQVALPTLAAIGGMVLPALIYAAFNWNNSTALNGWAIPSATDIAFSVGILTLLGKRIPLSLKIFLIALAIIDDLGAIIIIALFYSEEFNLYFLTYAILLLAVPALANFLGVVKLRVYLIIGVLLWFLVLKSGIHATLAGVLLAFFIPSVPGKYGHNLLHRLEETLHPWVAYGILPLFAFANAGVSFEGMTLGVLWEPIPLGIILGLVLGKSIGVLGFSWLTIKLGIALLPDKSNWTMVYGVAILCGVGFTMSLFIGSLAFTEAESINQVRLGVLLGSLISALGGYLVLLYATAKNGN